MDVERAALVSAFWAHRSLLAGSRQQRLASAELFWAWEAVDQAMEGSPQDAVSLLDDLLCSPEADPCYVGAGPLEALLPNADAELTDLLAGRCRSSHLWRAAMACVWPAERERQASGALTKFLRDR